MIKSTVDSGPSVAQRWFSEQSDSAPISSNIGSAELPFQRWFHFKEAYSPEFVRQAIAKLDYTPTRVLDPFAGSGTTAITCKIMGIDSCSIELNPFLVDLVQSKLCRVSPAAVFDSFARLIDDFTPEKEDYVLPDGFPPTLCQSRDLSKWIYNEEVFAHLKGLNRHIDLLTPKFRQLGKVILGAILVDCSNVVVNGKGRRYRKNWESRAVDKNYVLEAFSNSLDRVVEDLIRFSKVKSVSKHIVYHNDTRKQLRRIRSADFVIFSPPYPNSFDYTDVYNVELWMLGYFSQPKDNSQHRARTLRSHVQIRWPDDPQELDSKELSQALSQLNDKREMLWSPHIPKMLQGYFCDLRNIFTQLARILPQDRHAVAAVGDSRYAGVLIDVPKVLVQIVEPLGFEMEEVSPIRSMRSSAQHGGKLDLKETAISFRRI